MIVNRYKPLFFEEKIRHGQYLIYKNFSLTYMGTIHNQTSYASSNFYWRLTLPSEKLQQEI